eukprot:c18132_g1_i2 orf=47-730(+)
MYLCLFFDMERRGLHSCAETGMVTWWLESMDARVWVVQPVKCSRVQVKQGNVIERKGHIFQVLKTQHTQQGRGGATIQVELRDVQSGLKSTERLRTSEAIERVFVDEKSFTFLYHDGDSAILMEPTTFEQLEVPKILFGNGAAYLSDGLLVTVQFFDGKPLSAAVPSRVTCTVVEAEPSFKGQTATPVYKKVLLQNGRHVMVPPFISTGSQIVIDTTDDTYVTRAKD